jgi:hypothetical protein
MILILLLVLLFGAVACAAPEETVNETVGNTAVTTTTNSNNETQATRLNEDYNDALPVITQLAIGTIQLEETDLAVDRALAAEILPLWQAAQSLSTSDTAASIEVAAVLNPIQDAMSPAQVQAIAEMSLTADSMTALLESGAITFGRGAGRGQGVEGEGDAGFTPGQGGGSGGGGGPGGFGGGNLSEADFATRQAEFASGDGLAQIQDQAMVGAVIRLLQTKTGEVVENPRGGIVEAVFTAVSEVIGLPLEDLQTAMADGGSLGSVIEANGGDVTAVREAIIASLNALPNAADLDVEQLADSWLSE